MKDRLTMWDHLGAGTLEGKRVRFLADDAHDLVPEGSICTQTCDSCTSSRSHS